MGALAAYRPGHQGFPGLSVRSDGGRAPSAGAGRHSVSCTQPTPRRAKSSLWAARVLLAQPVVCWQELPFIQQLQPRMSAAASRLGVLLAQALQAVLAREVPSARQHCLHAYAAVGDFAGAEQVLLSRLLACLPS